MGFFFPGMKPPAAAANRWTGGKFVVILLRAAFSESVTILAMSTACQNKCDLTTRGNWCSIGDR